jgi:hypothetical protein
MAWPVTPSIPAPVHYGDLIGSAWTNNLRQSVADVWTNVQSITANGAPVVPASRQIIAGAGLSGGGDLSADRTLTVLADSVVERAQYCLNALLLSTRCALNVIAGGNMSITLTDNASMNRADLSVGLGPNVILATGSYANPAWITSLAWSKVSGSAPSNVVNAVDSTVQYPNPAWVQTLDAGKLTGSPPATVIAAAQTPWLQNINGNGKQLQNASAIGVGTAAPACALDVVGVLRSTGFAAPTSGAGVEIEYASGAGYVQAYDRTGAAYKALRVEGVPLALNSASGGQVGIGTAAPGATLHVVGISPNIGNAIFETYGVWAGVQCRRAEGTIAAPTAVAAGASIAQYGAVGYDGSGWGTTRSAAIWMNASAAWSPTNHSTWMTFETTAQGSVSAAERMRITDAGYLALGNDGSQISDSTTTDPRMIIGPPITVATTALGRLDLASNTTTVGQQVGVIQFVNYAIAAVNKRLALISAALDGATNSGKILLMVQQAGTILTPVTINSAGNVGIGNDASITSSGTNGELIVGQTNVVGGGFGTVTVSGNQASGSAFVGQVAFMNANITAADKRLVSITGSLDGAVNAGRLAFVAWTSPGVVCRGITVCGAYNAVLIQAGTGTGCDAEAQSFQGQWYSYAPSNTQLIFRMKGTDGVWRSSAPLTLS